MADDTYYAWSPIRYGDDSGLGSVRIGEPVTQDQINATDEDWAYLIQCGAVRTVQYPVPPEHAATQSPVNYLQDQAAKLAAAAEASFTLPGVEPTSGPSPDAEPASPMKSVNQ